jgi:hypothetical protein
MESTDARRSLTDWIILVAAFYLVWMVRATILYPIDESIESDTQRQLYSHAVRIALWIAPVFLYIRFVDKTGPLKYLKLTTRIIRPIESLLLILGYFAGMWAFESAMAGRSIFHIEFLTATALLQALLFASCAPIAEEIFFRGFALEKMSGAMKFWKSNLLTAFLFVLIHWPYWLYSQGFQVQKIRDSVGIFALGCFLGFLARRSGSLWPAIAAHWLNNFFAGYLR